MSLPVLLFFQQDQESDDEFSQRALSDQWRFRRKNRKWSRRGTKRNSSSIDFLNYSSEDLLSDNETSSDSSSLMLVSELRGSLTGLDRAVKTYSFLPTDDQIPKIFIDSPGGGSPTAILTGSQDSGGGDNNSGVLPKTGDIFHVNGGAEEKELSWEENDDEDVTSLGSSMDNFATGILDEFESNLLKWKTQSLPDLFAAVKHFSRSDSSSETSLLSSASESTNSVAESSKGETNHQKSSPVHDGRCASASGSVNVNLSATTNHISSGRATPDEIVRRQKFLSQKQMSEPKDRHQRFDSIGSTGTSESQSSSFVGSSEGDRDRGGVSASPLPAYPERQYVQNELGVGTTSPVKLRPKRASTGSEHR